MRLCQPTCHHTWSLDLLWLHTSSHERMDGAGLQPKAHWFTVPCSSDSLLSVCDKCLSSFLVYCAAVLGACRVRPAEVRQYTMKYTPPWLPYSRAVVRGGQLQGHSVVKFHFTLCVSIDFYWSLDKISQDIVKRPSPLCTQCLEKDRNRVRQCAHPHCECGCAGRLSRCWSLRVSVLSLSRSTFTLRGLSLGLLGRSEAQRFAQWARPRHADGLDMHNVVCLLLQVP